MIYSLIDNNVSQEALQKIFERSWLYDYLKSYYQRRTIPRAQTGIFMHIPVLDINWGELHSINLYPDSIKALFIKSYPRIIQSIPSFSKRLLFLLLKQNSINTILVSSVRHVAEEVVKTILQYDDLSILFVQNISRNLLDSNNVMSILKLNKKRIDIELLFLCGTQILL